MKLDNAGECWGQLALPRAQLSGLQERLPCVYCGEVVPSRRLLTYQMFPLTIYQTQLQYGQIQRLVTMFAASKPCGCSFKRGHSAEHTQTTPKPVFYLPTISLIYSHTPPL